MERGQRSLSSNLNGYSMKPKLRMREREGGRVHDHGEEAGGDRVETERGDGHEHSERLFGKKKKNTWDLSKDRGECKAGSGSPGR